MKKGDLLKIRYGKRKGNLTNFIYGIAIELSNNLHDRDADLSDWVLVFASQFSRLEPFLQKQCEVINE